MARTVSVDLAKIRNAKLAQFEPDENSYGVDWDTDTGTSGSDLIGTKEEAEAELRRIQAAMRTRLRLVTSGPVPHDSEVHVAADVVNEDAWRVEYFDDDGGCYVAIFAGPDAEQRARDYGAAIKGGALKRYGD